MLIGQSNTSLQKFSLFKLKYDIIIEAHKIKLKENMLENALSCINEKNIDNLYPYYYHLFCLMISP